LKGIFIVNNNASKHPNQNARAPEAKHNQNRRTKRPLKNQAHAKNIHSFQCRLSISIDPLKAKDSTFVFYS
jgi:hypothetical protein